MTCALELLEAALARASGRADEADTYEALVAAEESGDRAVGYACFGRTPMTESTYDLYWIVTAPEIRGGGVGARLLASVEGELRRRSAHTIRIETSSLEGQGGAQRFYERAGYAEVGLIRDFYRPGDDLVTLAKRLG